jgi:hypothetical protein
MSVLRIVRTPSPTEHIRPANEHHAVPEGARISSALDAAALLRRVTTPDQPGVALLLVVGGCAVRAVMVDGAPSTAVDHVVTTLLRGLPCDGSAYLVIGIVRSDDDGLAVSGEELRDWTDASTHASVLGVTINDVVVLEPSSFGSLVESLCAQTDTEPDAEIGSQVAERPTDGARGPTRRDYWTT